MDDEYKALRQRLLETEAEAMDAWLNRVLTDFLEPPKRAYGRSAVQDALGSYLEYKEPPA